MAEQIVEDGVILTTEAGFQIQCTAVSYQEDAEGNRFGHTYMFRSVAELTAEREAEEAAEKARQEEENAAQEGESPVLPVNPET